MYNTFVAALELKQGERVLGHEQNPDLVFYRRFEPNNVWYRVSLSPFSAKGLVIESLLTHSITRLSDDIVERMLFKVLGLFIFLSLFI